MRFRYAANTQLREASRWWACNSLKASPWANVAFREARDRRGHRALLGLGARWMRIAWHCRQNHTPYDPTKHGSAATLHTAA